MAKFSQNIFEMPFWAVYNDFVRGARPMSRPGIMTQHTAQSRCRTLRSSILVGILGDRLHQESSSAQRDLATQRHFPRIAQLCSTISPHNS